MNIKINVYCTNFILFEKFVYVQYIGIELFPMYRSWKKSKIVRLVLGGRSWTLGVYRTKKNYRFGRWWNEFATDNNLEVGKKLKNIHVGNSTFKVSKI